MSQGANIYQKLIWNEFYRTWYSLYYFSIEIIEYQLFELFGHSNEQLFEQDEYIFKFSRFNLFFPLTVYCCT